MAPELREPASAPVAQRLLNPHRVPSLSAPGLREVPGFHGCSPSQPSPCFCARRWGNEWIGAVWKPLAPGVGRWRPRGMLGLGLRAWRWEASGGGSLLRLHACPVRRAHSAGPALTSQGGGGERCPAGRPWLRSPKGASQDRAPSPRLDSIARCGFRQTRSWQVRAGGRRRKAAGGAGRTGGWGLGTGPAHSLCPASVHPARQSLPSRTLPFLKTLIPKKPED